jgi:hypothetical protein
MITTEDHQQFKVRTAVQSLKHRLGVLDGVGDQHRQLDLPLSGSDHRRRSGG